jgi:hypothetical protein
VASITFSLHSADRLTPRHSMRFYSQSDGNCVKNPNCVICMVPVEPTFTTLIATSEETSTPTYAVTGATATIDVTIVNDTGSALTSVTLTTSHDGNGSLVVGSLATTLANAGSVVVTLTYTTASEAFDVTVTAYATGTKSDATTATSNTVANVLDITGKIPPPPP